MRHYLAFERIIVVKIQFLCHFVDEAVFVVCEVVDDGCSRGVDLGHFFVFLYWTLVDFPVCNAQVFLVLNQVLLTVLYPLDVALPSADLLLLDPEHVRLPLHVVFFFAHLSRNRCDLVATETSTSAYKGCEIYFGP
jgi:hypothetical protein